MFSVVQRDRPLGNVQVFHPFPECPEVVFGRVAARSEAFGSTSASGGAPVMIGSAAGESADDVVVRARGELLERASSVLAGRAAESERRIVASFEELRRRGMAALDPAAWRELGAAIELRGVPLLWVRGRSLTTGNEVLAPAGAVFLRHRPPPGCAALVQAGSAGVSAHVSEQAATAHALLEVLERDLVWRSWYGTDGRALTVRRGSSFALDQALDALGLLRTVLVLPGPGRTACVVASLHAAQRRQQSFGARCVLMEGDGSLPRGIEVATYEALMVRWSMGTPVARRAWQRMRRHQPPVPPRNALEHALWTFHRQDSLGRWLAKAAGSWEGTHPATTAADEGRGDVPQLARLLAEHTGEEVVAVNTTVPGICSDDGITVVRVVAPGARRLPGDERSHSLSHEPGLAGCPPHPFG